jgi:hypothetical protein
MLPSHGRRFLAVSGTGEDARAPTKGERSNYLKAEISQSCFFCAWTFRRRRVLQLYFLLFHRALTLRVDFDTSFETTKCPRRSCAEGGILRISGVPLLRAGIAYHLKISSLEMSVLMVILFYPRIVGHVFRIFFQVVSGCV